MTHPHDFALLNDLLDERLTAAAAEDLRRRLADEPALAAAHAELVRMRAALAALPVPVGTPGGEFLARVRARAGLPPSVVRTSTAASPAAAAPRDATSVIGGPGVGRPDDASQRNGHVAAPTPSVAADPSAPKAPSGSSGSDVPPAPPAGRTLSLVRFAMPIAAVLGVALGAGLFVALRTDSAGETLSASAGVPGKKSSEAGPAATDLETKDARPTVPGAPARPDAEAAAEPARGAPAEAPSGRGRIRGGTGGGFRAPGGAVPEGLRTPSDVPAAPVPPPAPAPTLDAATPSDAATPPVAAPAAGSVTSAARPGATPPAETDAATDADAADAADGAARDDRTAAGAKRRAATPRHDLRAGLARAEEGVDEVVVVRAASLDEARAQIALLALAPRGGERGWTGGPRPSTEPRGADKLGAADPTAAHADAEQVLGSFVTELSAASYDALVSGAWAAPPTDARRRDLAVDEARASDAAKPGAASEPPARVPPPAAAAAPSATPPPGAVPAAPAPVPAPSGAPRSGGRAAPAPAAAAPPPAPAAPPPTTSDAGDDTKSEAPESAGATASDVADAAPATRRVRIVVLPR